MAATVLLVEDEQKLRQLLRSYLERGGFTVLSTGSGAEALSLAAASPPDLVVLDLGLPDVSGETVARELRLERATPILMLTARSSEDDRIRGLELGADDYVTKPFSMPELLARIRAALRRLPPRPEDGVEAIQLGEVEINLKTRRVSAGSRAARLTPKEFDLLQYFLAHPNESIAHGPLLQAVWGPDYGDEVEYLRVFVNQLRKKIEPDPSNPRYLLTEPWVGYRFQLPDTEAKT